MKIFRKVPASYRRGDRVSFTLKDGRIIEGLFYDLTTERLYIQDPNTRRVSSFAEDEIGAPATQGGLHPDCIPEGGENR